MLIAENISRRVGEQHLLENVSLTVAPGTMTALIGPSGAGKTTLLRSLALVDLPTGGRLRVGAHALAFPVAPRQALPVIWPALTVVFQQLHLWPHLSLFDNVALPLRLAGRADADAAARRALDRVGLNGAAKRFPNQTSVGERQRCALARAIALQPQTLLLDEITSALDVQAAASVLALIRELKNDGMGILVVTHSLHFVASSADTLLYLEGGRLLETGDRSILQQPRSAELKRFLSVLESTH